MSHDVAPPALRPAPVPHSGPVRVTPVAVMVAAACVAVSVVAGVLLLDIDARSNLALAAVGYAFGSLLAPASVVAHRVLVQRAARDVWYSPRHGLTRIANALLVVGMLSGAWSAFVLAMEIAKR